MNEKMIIIEGLQIWPEDLQERLTWHEAVEAAQSLGPGWRLPAIQELRETLYKYGAQIPGLNLWDRGEYWSCTLIDDNYSAWYFRFMSRDSLGTSRNDTRLVRPVRDFTGDVAIEYLLKDF